MGRERTAYPKRTAEETGRLGNEIYGRDIHPRVKDDHDGKVVSIDVDSGDYAIGENVIEATDRLWEKRPEAVDIWSLRVGYRGLSSFGARLPAMGRMNDRGRGELGIRTCHNSDVARPVRTDAGNRARWSRGHTGTVGENECLIISFPALRSHYETSHLARIPIQWRRVLGMRGSSER